jgi:hypothetical protein
MRSCRYQKLHGWQHYLLRVATSVLHIDGERCRYVTGEDWGQTDGGNRMMQQQHAPSMSITQAELAVVASVSPREQTT